MAFADLDDLTDRYDERILSDLVSDTGQRVANLTGNTRVSVALEDGAGRILAACLNGQIYSEADLTALTGSSLALLKRINCELAMLFLMGRRPEKFTSDVYQRAVEAAEEYLERLRQGQRLFDVSGAKDATVPEIDGPSTTQYTRLNLLPDRTRNFYPNRASRLPLWREG